MNINDIFDFPVIEQREGISHTNLEFLPYAGIRRGYYARPRQAMDAIESADMADDEETGFLSRVELGSLSEEMHMVTGHLVRMARHNERWN